jgi:type III restriction enzyme
MALHPDFPHSPHAILEPEVRWFPADEALRHTSMEKLMPPLVAQLRRAVKEFRNNDYAGASAVNVKPTPLTPLASTLERGRG